MEEEIRKLKFEEKNIKIIQELLMKYESEEQEPYEINYKELEAIRSILNLYLSEKEKNEKLEKERIVNHYIYENDFVSKDKIREIVYPSPENYISLDIQQSEMYKRLEELLEE